MIRALFTGGRGYHAAFYRLQKLHSQYRFDEVVHGDAPGVDTDVDNFAKTMRLPRHAYPADWNRYGNNAGPIRNGIMLKSSQPDIVFAWPGARGTRDMVERAEEAGIEVVHVVN